MSGIFGDPPTSGPTSAPHEPYKHPNRPGWNSYTAFRMLVPAMLQVKKIPPAIMKQLWQNSRKEFEKRLKQVHADPNLIDAGGEFKTHAAYLDKMKTLIWKGKKGTITAKFLGDTYESIRTRALEAGEDFGERYTPFDPTKEIDYEGNIPTNFPEYQKQTPLPQAGDQVSDLGKLGGSGQLTRGITHNLAGGEVDTQIKTTERGDDYVAVGGQAVNVATKTLRPSFVIAGGEEVRPDDEDNIQSNALFEAFSWVPAGFGLGPNNALHLQNEQHDQLRFGMEPLSAPRRLEDTCMTHAVPVMWGEALPNEIIQREMEVPGNISMMETYSYLQHERNPAHVLDGDYNRLSSSKLLPRQTRGPSQFIPTISNLDPFYPAYDPPGAAMEDVPPTDEVSGTMRHPKGLVFGVI